MILHNHRFSWIGKIFCLSLVLLGVGFSVQQLLDYFVPPPKGEQCRLLGLQEESHAQLIPEGTNSTSTSDFEAVSTPSALKVYDRAGFGLSSSADPIIWAERLGTSWYLDWDVQPISSKQMPAHWQMVRLKPGCIYPSIEYIRWAARRFPGNVWVIGNEPDVIWQDNLTPKEYAQDYHELYTLIKQADHTASIAVAGVAQATPLRLQYLDRVLLFYGNNYGEPMPVDWWTLHGYVLPEKRGSWGVGIPPGLSDEEGELYTIEDHGNINLFKANIENFRIWMTKNGYGDKPLAITEFGILIPESFGYSQYWISKYAIASITWLETAKNDQIGLPGDENRLVQRWAWFSLSDPNYPNSNLANLDTGELTLIGEAYQDFNHRFVK